jgi:hypothetical protein
VNDVGLPRHRPQSPDSVQSEREPAAARQAEHLERQLRVEPRRTPCLGGQDEQVMAPPMLLEAQLKYARR